MHPQSTYITHTQSSHTHKPQPQPNRNHYRRGFSLKLRRFLWLVVIEVVGQESCECSALAACSSAPLTSYLRAGRGLQECCRSAIGSRDSPASSLVFVLLTLPPPRPPPRASTTGQSETPSRRQLLFGEPKC